MVKRKKLNQAFKKKYQNKIIHQSADHLGHIQVIDDGMIRSMHFDAVEKQSAMDLECPEKLALSYTQFMMAGFLFHKNVSRVLCIGLGGGAIPRFLGHYFENCHVDVVEIREQVITVAENYFLLPTNAKFRYFQDDGSVFVNRQRVGPYDMILVDAYDHKGVAEEVTESSFAEASADLLTANGIYCTNLWSYPQYVYRKAIGGITQHFGELVLEIPVRERTNRIVLAIKPPWQIPSLQTLKRRSKMLEEALNIPFRKITASLLRNNKELFT
jgi:spermidine synthase